MIYEYAEELLVFDINLKKMTNGIVTIRRLLKVNTEWHFVNKSLS